MPENQPSDADLVAQTLAGNREAFGCLYDRHARIVRAVVGAVSREWSAVEDMAQESFLRAYKNLAKLRDGKRFQAWVVGIARQVARERKRSLRRDRHQFVGNQPLEIISDGATETLRGEVLELILQNVATLPERERLAIHAFFLEQRDARRAADALALSRSGFYALLERALARLAEAVRGRAQEKKMK